MAEARTLTTVSTEAVPPRPEEVFASLPSVGPAKTLAEMEAGILAEAKRQHAGWTPSSPP